MSFSDSARDAWLSKMVKELKWEESDFLARDKALWYGVVEIGRELHLTDKDNFHLPLLPYHRFDYEMSGDDAAYIVTLAENLLAAGLGVRYGVLAFNVSMTKEASTALQGLLGKIKVLGFDEYEFAFHGTCAGCYGSETQGTDFSTKILSTMVDWSTVLPRKLKLHNVEFGVCQTNWDKVKSLLQIRNDLISFSLDHCTLSSTQIEDLASVVDNLASLQTFKLAFASVGSRRFKGCDYELSHLVQALRYTPLDSVEIYGVDLGPLSVAQVRDFLNEGCLTHFHTDCSYMNGGTWASEHKLLRNCSYDFLSTAQCVCRNRWHKGACRVSAIRKENSPSTFAAVLSRMVGTGKPPGVWSSAAIVLVKAIVEITIQDGRGPSGSRKRASIT